MISHLKYPLSGSHYLNSSRITILILLIGNGICNAQIGLSNFQGARSIGLASCTSVLEGPDALLNNYSNVFGLVSETKVMLGSERVYLLNELQSHFFGVHFPINNKSAIGTSLSSYGFSEYRHSILSFSYAQKLDDQLSLSLRLEMNSLSIQEYGSDLFPGYALGFTGNLDKNNSMMLLVSNISKIKYAHDLESDGSIVLGYTRRINSLTDLYLEIEQIISARTVIKIAVKYNILKDLDILLGYSTNPSINSFGFSYRYKDNLRIDLSAQTDQLLGISIAAMVVYSFQ